MKTVFSGIQPSGNLHIGNYIGALSQWVKIQDEREAIFCIVDLHAITVPQDPIKLREKVLEMTAFYIAAGIDTQRAHIFVQSENPDHTTLTWILNCITSMGQLTRMTQFKDKSKKTTSFLEPSHPETQFLNVEGVSAGLFDYPVLMAADILLYQTDEVPVGEDQKQHVELTRDLAEKFNAKFGPVFKLPLPVIQKETARIMSLQDPTSKMSKSDTNQLATIYLLDTEEQIREKIKKAVTDSGSKISKDEGSAAISNLLAIYSSFKEQSLSETLDELDGKMYSEFKSLLADLLVQKLSEIQKKYQAIRNDEAALRQVLDEGRDYAIGKSHETLARVKELVGL